MNDLPNDDGDANEHAPTIFGQSHELLAEIAGRAAREAADEHVRGGRLAPERCPEAPATVNPAEGEPS